MRYRLPLFYMTTVFLWISLYAYIPYVAPYAEEMGADFRLIGIIAGAYGFTQMLLRFPLGMLSDKLQMRKNFILIGLFFAALSGFIVYFFPTPFSLMMARGLGGVSVSAWVIILILWASYFSREETTKAAGYILSANALGRVAAFLLGGLAAEQLGFAYTFLLGGIAGLVALILAFGIIEKKPDEEQKPPGLHELLDVAKNHQLLSASILGLLTQYILFATTMSFMSVSAIHLGIGNLQLGILTLAAIFPGLFISPLAGTLLPRVLGVKYTLLISFILAALGSAAVPFCQNMWQLLVVQIISNVGLVASFTLLMGLCIQDIPNEHRGTGMGLFQAIYALGIFLGPFIMGFISHWLGLSVAFVFTGALGIVGAAASVFFVGKGYLRYIN